MQIRFVVKNEDLIDNYNAADWTNAISNGDVVAGGSQ